MVYTDFSIVRGNKPLTPHLSCLYPQTMATYTMVCWVLFQYYVMYGIKWYFIMNFDMSLITLKKEQIQSNTTFD